MLEQIDIQATTDMGFAAEGVAHIWNTLRTEIANKTIPSAVAVISRGGKRIRFAAGYSVDWSGVTERVSFDTLYDCASLTKIAVTLPLVLLLIDRGKLALDEAAMKFLPELGKTDKEKVTIHQLLTHSSGLASSCDMHSHGWSREEIISSICEAPLVYAPGTRVEYSDLGFILLGEIITSITRLTLDKAIIKYIFQPLGMRESNYCPPPELLYRIAATEYASEIKQCWQGVVHDENARAMNGISGHAGLFSTADEIMHYAEMWLNRGKHQGNKILSEAIVKAAISSHTTGIPSANRGLGWVLKGDSKDASGQLSSMESYGHTGFTGTSILIDPQRQMAAVLLTNCVHYGRDKSVSLLREAFHNAIIEAL